MKNIIRFFAKEHLFGNLLTVLFVVFGIIALTSIKRDIWPNVDFNLTTISAFLGGASPEQVEKLLINPMEEALREVDGLKKVTSTATESKAVIVVQIDENARDPDKTNNDIQSVIDRLQDLPDEVEKPIVTPIDTSKSPIIEVTVGGSLDEIKIRDTAKFIADEISLMPRVASVTKNGYRKREYVVEASPQRLSERKVSLSTLVNSITQQNVSTPSGTVKNQKEREVLIRTEGQYKRAEDILKTVILANEAGYGTSVIDVARVSERLAKPEVLYHSNGKDAINLVVAKKNNADALNLVEDVKKKVNELRKSVSEKIDLGFSNDFSVYLSKRLGTLVSNLLIGLFLVIIVLSIFLPWQMTMVVAAGIPVAFLGTLVTAYLMGNSLNLISLIGLIIVLGMLVDDAIVVSENIWRHIEEKNEKLSDAVINGASEVFAPVMASILTTVSAFAPMMFMTGVFGKFIYEIPVMVILALAFSLFEVFIIMPSHVMSWVGPFLKGLGSQDFKLKKKATWFDKIVDKYVHFVDWTLRFRYIMLSFIFTLLIGTGFLLHITGRFVLFPPEGVERFFVQVEAPIGTSITKMSTLLRPVEEKIATLDKGELKDFTASIGLIQQDANDPQTKRGSNYAHIRVGLTPQSDRKREATEIIEELRTKVGLPDGLEKITFQNARTGPPQGRPISIDILGKDFSTLREISGKVKTKLNEIEGVLDPQDSFVPGKKEWQVVPRFQDTASVGLSALSISQTVRAAFEGLVASQIRKLDEEIDIRVRLEQKTGSIENQLKTLKIGNNQGHLVELGKIADFRTINTISSISHKNYQRTINISAEVDIDKNTAINITNQLKPYLTELLKSYPQYDIEFGGEDRDTKDSMQSLARSFIFAALIIFFLLVTTFKNILQPVLILTSIPVGFLGVVYAILIHNRPFSFMAMLGVIALAGVIVNNAIVFTDFVNTQRKNGEDLNESIKSAARFRLRPIFLTTLTTVVGLLPTAYGETLRKVIGIGGGDPFIVPIALALGWGLAFGSIMTATFFPSFIRILDDIAGLFKRQKKV